MHHPTAPIRHRFILLFLLSFVVRTAGTGWSIGELWQRADQLWQSDDLDSALSILQQIERLQPGDRSALLGIGAIYQRRREFDHALEILHAVSAQEPRNPTLLQRIGEIYTDKGEIPNALEYLHAAEQVINPSNVEEVNTVTHLLALAYHHGGDFTTAEYLFNRVSKSGRSAAYYFDFGVTLERLGKIVAAGDAYNEALEIEPTQPQARINIAVLHHQYGNVNESIPHYLYVINLPSSPVNLKIMAMGNVGVAYEVSKDIVSALSWFERALEEVAASPDMIFPDGFTAQTSQMHLMVHVVRAKLSACVWANAEDEFDSLWSMVMSMQLATGTVYAFTPFDSLLHKISPYDRKMLAMQVSTKYTVEGADQGNTYFTPPVKRSEDERLADLNVGYLSYDYSDHPTMHLMEGIFATRDQKLLKVTAFGYGRDDGSAFRRRVIKSVDKFVDLSSASFEESVAQIRGEHIQIIMDAQGHTRGGRMQIVAARPAPIVVNYLVYPGTSGAPFVDYVVVDKFVVPPAEVASAFTEKLVVLPHSYQVNYYDQLFNSSNRISRRADLWEVDEHEGKDDGFVFVNFNKIDKLEASVFSTWMAILRRVPRSSLVLLDPGRNIPGDDVTVELVTSREIKKNLRSEAHAQGVESRRIRFVRRIPKLEHLQRHRFGGLFLDTLIYGAHSTATDALFAGLPVLTLAGDSFASRVGVSLLQNLGMQDLVTFSRKEYEDLAVYLATTPPVLLRLQRRLRSSKTEFEQPLFDTKLHTHHLETGQRLMYDIYSLTNRTFHLVV